MRQKHFIKIIISLVLLTAFIIGSGLFTQWILNKDTQKLNEPIEGILKNTEAKDWNKVSENLDSVDKLWLKVKGTWAALVDHQEIDNIEEALTRLKMFVQTRDVPNTMAEASALKKFVEHIPVKDRLSLENVF